MSKKVFIGVGHGGTDSGAVDKLNIFCEGSEKLTITAAECCLPRR